MYGHFELMMKRGDDSHVYLTYNSSVVSINKLPTVGNHSHSTAQDFLIGRFCIHFITATIFYVKFISSSHHFLRRNPEAPTLVSCTNAEL